MAGREWKYKELGKFEYLYSKLSMNYAWTVIRDEPGKDRPSDHLLQPSELFVFGNSEVLRF